MSWLDEVRIIVRHSIDDVAGSVYSDSQLNTFIYVSAQLLQKEVSFPKTYVVTLSPESITPDPLDGDRDDGFLNLCGLKAAASISSAEAKAYSVNGISVTDGPSNINLSSAYKNKQEQAKQANEEYLRAKMQYQIGFNPVGQSVTGPSPLFNPPREEGNF